MVPSTDAAALLERRRHDDLVLPDYERYCVANVPGTVGDVLGVDAGRSLPADALDGVETDVSQVVVVLLDCLGWHRLHRDAADHRFLRRLVERGTVTPLTSVASASTAPAITSVHTGVPPAEHGIVGGSVRLPDHDTIARPFTHEVRADVAAGDGTLPGDADDLVAADTVYQGFTTQGADARIVQPAEDVGDAYANAVFDGARISAYEGVDNGADRLRRAVATDDGPAYTYWYTAELDSITHEYGPDSGAYHDALGRITEQLSRALYDRVDAATARETLLVVAADHGAVPLDPPTMDPIRPLEMDAVRSRLRQRHDGAPFPPFGDPRLCHFSVQPGHKAAVVEALEATGATAFTRSEAADLSLFGDADGPGWERCGDVVATHSTRPFVYPGMEKVTAFEGIHGGLTEREMLVPFAAARLSRLRD